MSRCGPGTVEAGFSMRNPEALRWAETRSAELVVDIVDETRLALRNVISRVFSEGIPPAKSSRLIRDIVGLTNKQAQAVMNARARLVASGMKDEAIERKTARYAEQLRKQRSLTIARTETMRAANEGQRQLWNQAVQSGLIAKDEVRRVWMTSLDELTCPICSKLDKKKATLDGLFSAPGIASIQAPPAHPNCRCSTRLDYTVKTKVA